MHKPWIGFLAAASAVCFWMLAKTGTDAAKLLPARVLVIEERDGAVRVSSDNGAAGSGETLAAALQQMERSAEGALFLDTAEHIVLLRPSQALLEQTITQPSFRPAAKLYVSRAEELDVSRAEELDASALVELLRAHPGKLTLSQARAALLRGEPLRPAVLKLSEEGGVMLGE